MTLDWHFSEWVTNAVSLFHSFNVWSYYLVDKVLLIVVSVVTIVSLWNQMRGAIK